MPVQHRGRGAASFCFLLADATNLGRNSLSRERRRSRRFHPIGGRTMKRAILAGIAVLALAGPALAQTTIQTAPAPAAPTAGATVTLAPEQRTRIKNYVVEHKVRPVTVKERVTVGATLPADVDLVAVPGDWGPDLARYRYVYSDNHVVLVEPSSRRVIQIIE